MDEVDKVYSKLQSIENSFGILGVIIALIIGISIWGLSAYFSKLVEKLAEESSEKSLKKYQTNLDKGLALFSVKATARHQKQVDAIQEVYTRFQGLKSLINFMMNGDKYYQGLDGYDEVNQLIERRTNFKLAFNNSRILFPKSLCERVDALVISVEDFIDTYKGGLMPRKSAEELEYERERMAEVDPLPGVIDIQLGGIWRHDAFDEVLSNFEQIGAEIEDEFRKIHGV